MGDYPAASATSAAHISTEEEQQDRASRNDARCAVIIVFAKQVGLMHLITNTFSKIWQKFGALCRVVGNIKNLYEFTGKNEKKKRKE